MTKPISKKNRQWFLGVALISISVLVWWVYVYSPLKQQRGELEAGLSHVSQERDRMEQRLKRLSNIKQNQQERQETLDQLSGYVVQGNGLEEISGRTQLWVQNLLENQALSLEAYKGLSPSKWRDYSLSRVQFQLNTTTQGLSDLLENLENLEKAIRIEKLSVTYRRSRENPLRVSMHLCTLFLEGLVE